jgi:hypothetical protein
VNIEKVLYALVNRCRPLPVDDNADDARGKSLPAPSLIRLYAESLPPPSNASFIAAARCDVMSAIIAHMLENKFCVAAKDRGGKAMVLNTEGDDVCVDVEVLATQRSAATVILSGDQAAVEDVHRFLSGRFGATSAG